jgi:hypothetical protein
MKAVIFSLLLLASLSVYGQGFTVKGELLDENAKPLSTAAAVLLDPSDFTLMYFSVTGRPDGSCWRCQGRRLSP